MASTKSATWPILVPKGQGRRGAAFEAEIAAFCRAILDLRSSLEFAVSARGWCYVLEEHGLDKGDFKAAEYRINTCRKNGMLPVDICAVDESREAENLEKLDNADPEDEAAAWIETLQSAHETYAPFSFWEFLDVYIEVWVEKIDLRSLFAPVCAEFYAPIVNMVGWADINSHVAAARRFKHWGREGKKCILLTCCDHDPGGLQISGYLRQNFEDIADAADWRPTKLIIERFGLNADFIRRHRLTWIDNLETASGRRLDDPSHSDHLKPYVQDYIKQFGVRKVEANALVVRPDAGRELCRQAILKYVPEDAPRRYLRRLARPRRELREEIAHQLRRFAGR